VLVRSITRREPEFSDYDLDLMLASLAFEGSIGSHGHLLSEAMSPEADPTNYDSTLRFSARGPFFDFAKKAEQDDIDRYKSEFPEGSPPNLNGAYWVVEKHGELAANEVHEGADE
jgi:hypothetical protein